MKITQKHTRRHGGFSRLETLILGGVGALSCLVLWPALAQVAPENGQKEPLTDAQMAYKCQTNLKQIGLAVMQYTQDYDEKYPLAASRSPRNGDDDVTPVGWADAIQPYMKSTDLLQCPAEKHPSSTTRVKGGKLSDAAQLSGFTDYWYNANLSNLSLLQVEDFSKTILFGEGNGGAINSNARYTLDALYPRWIKDPQSPVYRHAAGTNSNYCFADGHVIALPPDKVGNKPPSLTPEGEATFEEGVGAAKE